MSPISGISRSAAVLAVMSTGMLVSMTVVHADNSPANPGQENYQGNPLVKNYIADAMKAEKNGDIPLAMIELKNALRLDPHNGALHTLLGVTLLQSNQAVAAEHELRQGRLEGARDQDVVPPLLQSMATLNEWHDVLDQFPDPAPDDKSSLAKSILSARALAYQSLGDDSDAISSIDRSLEIQRDVSALLARVEIAMAQSNSSDAMTYVNEALALAPNDPNVLITKAQIISISDKKTALAIIDGVLKSHPDALNASMAKIEVLIELGRIDEAQQSVDSVLARVPDVSFAVFYKAFLLGMHNRPKDGWRIAEALPSGFIQSGARFAIGVAKLAAQSGNFEVANSILTTYVGQHPAITESRLELAALHLKMNNPSDALNDLGPLMDSKDPRVLEYIAATYVKLKRQSDAITYLRKADAAGSNTAGLKSQLAIVDLSQGDISQGTKELLDGMKTQPGNLSAPEVGIDLLLKRSKFVEAQALADQAETTNPKSPAPLFFKGEILLAQGKKDDGLVAINQSLQRDPHFLPALSARADAFMAQNKFADATEDLKQVQALQPNNPSPYVKLSEIAYLSGQLPQSIALLKQAISKDPNLISTRLILARYQITLKQYADAEATLKTALKISSNDLQALALLGQVQLLMGQNAAALATSQILVNKNQQSGAAQFLLGNSLQQSGDKIGAVTAFKRAVELNPDVLQYRSSLIDLQIQSGDNDGAVATARDWRNNHGGPDAAILLAQTLARLKRFPEAASVIASGQTSHADWRLALLDSQIATARGNRAQAIAILKKWLTDHASDLPVRVAYANALNSANDDAGALAQYEIILKSRNDIPEVLNDTAWLIRDTDPGRALALASKALQLQPNSPDIADTFGLLLLKKGDTKTALPLLQRAHTMEPASGDISYHLALALNALGMKADAKQVILAALANNTSFLDAADAKKLLQKL